LNATAPAINASSAPVVYGFTGRQLDAESGLYHYRARVYDAGTARFLQPDPIGFEGGDSNLYRYVRNRPLMYRDPMGLWAWPWNIYEEAATDAAELYPDDPHGAQDAYRHCLASCLMTVENGTFATWALGESNEIKGDIFNGQSTSERDRDTSNNACGTYHGWNGGSRQSCAAACGASWQHGVLR